MSRTLEQAYVRLKADPDYLGQILTSPKKDTLATLLFEEFARRQELPPQTLVDALPREYRLRQLKTLRGEEKERVAAEVGKLGEKAKQAIQAPQKPKPEVVEKAKPTPAFKLPYSPAEMREKLIIPPAKEAIPTEKGIIEERIRAEEKAKAKPENRISQEEVDIWWARHPKGVEERVPPIRFKAPREETEAERTSRLREAAKAKEESWGPGGIFPLLKPSAKPEKKNVGLFGVEITGSQLKKPPEAGQKRSWTEMRTRLDEFGKIVYVTTDGQLAMGDLSPKEMMESGITPADYHWMENYVRESNAKYQAIQIAAMVGVVACVGYQGIQGIIGQVRYNHAIKTMENIDKAYKNLAAGKATVADKALITQWGEAVKNPAFELTPGQLAKLSGGPTEAEYQAKVTEALGKKVVPKNVLEEGLEKMRQYTLKPPTTQPPTSVKGRMGNLEILKDVSKYNLMAAKNNMPLIKDIRTLQDAAKISTFAPPSTSEVTQYVGELKSIGLAKDLITNWGALTGQAAKAVQVPAAVTQAGPEVITAFNSVLVTNALSGASLGQAMHAAMEVVKQVQTAPVTPTVPTAPVVAKPTAKEPRNIIHEAMRLYDDKEFRPYALPSERWVQAKTMAEQGKTEFEQASTDVILTMLQDKGTIDKELLVNQFGEEAVDALVKDKFLQEKPGAKVEEPEAFRAGLPMRPAVMALTPKAKEFLSMMDVAREIAPAKTVMSETDMTRLGEEDASIIDEASFNIISGGEGGGRGGVTIPEPPGLPPEEKWRRRGANIIRIVDGYVSLERLHDLQARTGITITYNELDKAQLSGPAIPFIQEQLNLTAYPDLEREALDYVLAQVVPRGAHRTRVIGAKPDRIRRQLNKQWARQVIQREHQIHNGLQKIRGSLTPEAATERLSSDLMLEATNRGWIENQAGKIILTDQGIKRRQMLPELQKALHEVDRLNRKEAWIPAGQNITGLIMNKEGSGNLARFLVQNYTTTTDPITGDVYKTGRGLVPVIDDFLTKGGVRFHLVKYLTAKTVMDRVEFQNRPGNEQTIGPKLAKTAQDVVEAYERGNYPLLIETAKAIWPAQGERVLSPEVMRGLFDDPTKTDAWNQVGWWGRVLKELRPSEEEFARLIDAHPHYVPLMVPKKGATTELDDFTSNLLQDLYKNPTWGKSQRTPLYDFEGHGNIFLDPLESSIDLMNPYADFMLGREIQLDILDFIEKYPLWQQHFKEVPKMKPDTKTWAYIRMWDKNKKEHYFRIAPDFKQAMTLIQGIQPHIPNFISKWIATPVRYLTRSVTTYNPLFPIWNFFKDQWHAWASLHTPYVPVVGILEGWTRLIIDEAQHAGLPTDFTEPMLASIMESYNVRGGLISRAGTVMGHEELRKAERGWTVLSRALHNMMEIARDPALKQAFADDQTTHMPPSLRKQLRQQIQDAAITTAKEELATTAKGIGKVLTLPFKTIALMSEASEAATRMSTYATIHGRGASTLKSYIEHARAGVNFRRGQSTALDLIVRAFIPFGMPNIIGKGTRIYKLTDPIERVGSWLRLGPLALIAALSTLFVMTTNEYKKLPYRKRLENIYFPIYKREKDPKTGKTKLKLKRLGRIPVGREDLGMVHATVVAILNYLAYKEPEVFKILLTSIFRESFDWLGQVLIAQLAFEWDAEYDLFFEKHIVPESARELPAQFQSNRYTSQVFKETAEGLARTFPFLEGQKWMKPAMLEHGFLTFTGNAGQNIWLPGGDWLLRQMGVPVDITRPKVDPIEVVPIAVRPGSIWSTQPVKSFRQDMQHLTSVQQVIKTRYKQYTNADQLSFDAKPEKPSGKTNIHYFDDLLVIIKGKTGEVVPYNRMTELKPGDSLMIKNKTTGELSPYTASRILGMEDSLLVKRTTGELVPYIKNTFESGDSLWVDENAIGSMTSRPKLLIHEFRQRPEIFMIYEQTLVTARWKQVEWVADMYKKILEASDRTVLGPDLTGRNPRDANNIPFFNRYPQVADFYDHMAKKHPDVPIEDYGKIDPTTKTRTYIAEWKREELQQLTDMATVLAEIGHYEYQLLYRKGGLSQEKALSAVDASVVEYTNKWGDYNPMFETIIRTWLGQNIKPFTTPPEEIEPKLECTPFMYNPATAPGITPKTGTELLLGKNKQ